MTNRTEAANQLAAQFVDQMSDDDRDGFTVDGWRGLVDYMIGQSDSPTADLDSVLDTMGYRIAQW